MALKNPLAYFNTYHIFGSDSGDLDGYRTNPSNFAPNGRLDFDDIDDFAALMAAGSGGSAADMLARIQAQLRAVPEPGAMTLMVLGSFCLFLVRGERRLTCRLVIQAKNWTQIEQLARIWRFSRGR